jgi:5-methylcytosine-specific restriction enzyme A
MTRYWMMRSGSKAKYWDEFRDNNIIRLGFDEFNSGDLSEYPDRASLREYAARISQSTSAADMQWNFSHEMAIGDTVFVCKGLYTICGYGEVTSEYRHTGEREVYRHERNIRWIKTGDRRWIGDKQLMRNSLVEWTENPKLDELIGLMGKRKLPDVISSEILAEAIAKIDDGFEHSFKPSTKFDVLYNSKRYPPKAVVGVAAEIVTGERYIPDDFSGGVGSKCFRILQQANFIIVTKANYEDFPEEFSEDDVFVEGASKKVLVNKYERDPQARKKCIQHYGSICVVCNFDFEDHYGSIGEGFIHVHHLKPISEIGEEYKIDPILDLRPVCPNCHAMLHKGKPTFSIEELKRMISDGL